MKQIPDTSPTAYLTGSAALNIPTEEGDFADWHFTETFLGEKGDFRITGKNFIDTNEVFGTYGIRECSGILRRYGADIEEGGKVYAANFVRAALDLIYKNVAEHKMPAHIRIDDILDDEAEQSEFFKKLQLLKSTVSDNVQLTLLDQWEKQQ